VINPLGYRQPLLGKPPSTAAVAQLLACAALAAVQAARPLKPPPVRFERYYETAAARALRADKRRGLL
jgi:hypothetical protein